MPGRGRKFDFFTRTKNVEKARKKESSTPGSFIIPCKHGTWCVVKEKAR